MLGQRGQALALADHLSVRPHQLQQNGEISARRAPYTPEEVQGQRVSRLMLAFIQRIAPQGDIPPQAQIQRRVFRPERLIGVVGRRPDRHISQTGIDAVALKRQRLAAIGIDQPQPHLVAARRQTSGHIRLVAIGDKTARG